MRMDSGNIMLSALDWMGRPETLIGVLGLSILAVFTMIPSAILQHARYVNRFSLPHVSSINFISASHTLVLCS
jgi:hypothetical protein